jgi:hypothetical protein
MPPVNNIVHARQITKKLPETAFIKNKKRIIEPPAAKNEKNSCSLTDNLRL